MSVPIFHFIVLAGLYCSLSPAWRCDALVLIIIIKEEIEVSKMASNPQMFSTKGYDSKKLAYIILTCGLFVKCECSVVNNDPQEIDKEYIFPRDMYIGDVITDETAGTYQDFFNKLGSNRSNVLHCTCALDKTDIERITFISISDSEGVVSFTLLNKSKHDPNALFNSLMKKYNENL